MNDTSVSAYLGENHVIGVGVVVLREADSGVEVLLIRRGKPPRIGEWSIPGGRQELGETVRETAVREIREETDLTISNLALIEVVDTFRKDDTGNVAFQWTLVDFRAWWQKGAARAGSDALEVRWVPIAELNSYDLWHETVRVIGQALAMPSDLNNAR
jgi:8-oxo-dGTP diphosphatase